ncbi:MAG: hypothetical protein J7513_02420 [Solirubrobacteraceae bacterium]|nr:hypothetical protein [Solirubrobacteraceae bacterium]
MTFDPKTEPGAESGAEGDASADTKLPFEPRKDDQTPMGDTDQHSKADHDQDPADDIVDGSE